MALFEKLGNKKIRCKACMHKCVIPEDKKGICGVRCNKNGVLELLVYEKTASVNIDPIEKKPLYHFLPGSRVFSIGTYGCNFHCLNCQNWEISQTAKDKDFGDYYGKTLKVKEIVDNCNKNNIKSIAYTYNEPVVWVEYAYDTAKLASKNKIKNIFVSNGYMSEEALKLIKPHLNAVNIDLKSFSESFYKKICGAELKYVLDNIKKIHEAKIWMEITTLVIPGKNDSNDELKKIAGFIAKIDKNIPWHVSGFHPMYKMLDVKSTPITTLIRAYEIGKKAGLRHVYIGNIADEKYNSTFCYNCGSLLIKRNGYNISIENLKKDKCGKCGEKISGVWE